MRMNSIQKLSIPGICFEMIVTLYLLSFDNNKAVVNPTTPALRKLQTQPTSSPHDAQMESEALDEVTHPRTETLTLAIFSGVYHRLVFAVAWYTDSFESQPGS
jgi:hypothetical protein